MSQIHQKKQSCQAITWRENKKAAWLRKGKSLKNDFLALFFPFHVSVSVDETTKERYNTSHHPEKSVYKNMNSILIAMLSGLSWSMKILFLCALKEPSVLQI